MPQASTQLAMKPIAARLPVMVKGDWINDKVPDPAPKALPGDAAATPALPLFWDRRYLGGRDGWDLGQPLAPHLPGRS